MSNQKACITCHQEFPDDETVCPDDGTILTPLGKDKYVGTTLQGRYEMMGVIGGGGMGLVYKARHTMMNRIVAIKMLHQHLTSSPDALKRFKLEAQAASCIRVPNILDIYDFGVSDDGQPYMVMDYLEGISLMDILEREKRLPVLRALNIFIQACAGLSHAHQSGVLHRDLKPSNIMLVDYGEDQIDFVKIVDFGIAKLLNPTDGESADLTKTGEVYGSPLYMSPEQCRGQELDARSDLYSFGCVMYKTLTGHPVFTGNEVIELLFKQVSETPASFNNIAPDANLPPDLEKIVFKTFEKNPDRRFSSMSELKDVLEEYRRKIQGNGGSQEPEDEMVSVGSASVAGNKFLGSGRGGAAASSPTHQAGNFHAGPLAASIAAAKTRTATVSEPAKPSSLDSAIMTPAAEITSIAPPAVAEAPVSERKVMAETPVVSQSEPSAASLPPATSAAAVAPPSPKSAGEFVRSQVEDSTNAGQSRMRPGKGEPEWLNLLRSIFANRLVVAALAGVILVAIAVVYMGVAALHQHSQLHQTDVDDLQLKAQQSIKTNNAKEAISQYTHARQLQEKVSGTNSLKVAGIAISLAQVYIQTKDYKNAQTELTNAIVIQSRSHDTGPDAVEALSLRSDVFLHLGDRTRAQADLQTALALESQTGKHAETPTQKKFNALQQQIATSDKDKDKDSQDNSDSKNSHKSAAHHKSASRAHRHAYSSYGF